MLRPQLAPDEAARIASLRSLGVLDTPAEERFDRITRMAAAVLDVPIALVSLVDTNRQWFKSCFGLGVSETPRDVSFCGHAILRAEPLLVPDATADERFADNPLVTGEPGVRFYLGFPLRDGLGHNLGTLCMIDREPRTVSTRELAVLGELALWAAEELRSIGLERAVAQYRASLATLDAISDVLVDGLITIDDMGTIVAMNSAAERMFGYTQSETLGTDIGFLMPATFEPEQKAAGGSETAPEVEAGYGSVKESIGRRADGTEFPMDLAISPIGSGESLQRICLIRDITERKDAEQRLRESEALHRGVVEAMAEGMVVHDASGAIIASNVAAGRILGLEADQIAGRTATDPRWRAVREDGTPFPGGDHPAVVTLRSGKPCREVVMGVHRPDDTLNWISINSEPLIAADGAVDGDRGPSGVVCTFADITHRLEVDRMKSEFVSVVSHELRTPLTSIRGALGLLAGGMLGALPERPQRMLDIAVTNTDRLVRLISDILDIERIESGRVSLLTQQSNAAHLIEQSVEVMQAMADKAEVRLEAESCSAPLWVDPDRIIQTLTNLISNAIKFATPGTSVRVSAALEGDDVTFSVADEGRGIPADKLESIFGRFQQVDASDSRDKGGTGLGLAICKSIVEQHGGRIMVHSVEGEGSTFAFTLPCLANAADHAPSPADPSPGPNGLSPGPTVVVCDDDPAIRTIVAALLSQSGCQVLPAATGEEAIALARASRPDVVLLDLGLPGLSGCETARHLAQDDSTTDIPVVIVSGMNREDVEGPVTSANWVSKPFTKEELVGAVERALDRRLPSTRVLLVEDDEDLGRIMVQMFEDRGIATIHATTIKDAIALIERDMPDLIVLDLALPDGDGHSIAEVVGQLAPAVAPRLMVYSARDLEANERGRFQFGNAEFHVKGQVPPELFAQRVVDLLVDIANDELRRAA